MCLDRGHLMLDSLYTVPCCGEVQQWEMYVEQPGRVQLQVWRGTASGYQLVGQNNFTLTSGPCGIFSLKHDNLNYITN